MQFLITTTIQIGIIEDKFCFLFRKSYQIREAAIVFEALNVDDKQRILF